MSSRQRQALCGIGAGRMLVGMATLQAAGRDDVPLVDSLPQRAVIAARLLAVRDLVQGASLVLAPEGRDGQIARNSIAIDSLHAASMLPLAVVSTRYRTAATLSAASALMWVAVTAIARRV